MTSYLLSSSEIESALKRKNLLLRSKFSSITLFRLETRAPDKRGYGG